MTNTLPSKLAGLVGILLVAVSASGSTWWFISRAATRGPSSKVLESGALIADSRTLRSGATLMYTGPSADTLLVFSDYQCPGCRILEASLDSLWKSGSPNLAVAFRHFPLDIHPLARVAATAVECAARTGNGRTLHHRLFQEADGLTSAKLLSLLESVSPGSTTCVLDDSTGGRVDGDLALARSLNLGGTPALVWRGRLYYGGLHVDSLRALMKSPSEGVK